MAPEAEKQPRPILFVGEGWRGSCARSLREGLERLGCPLDQIAEDAIAPHWRSTIGRAALRLGARIVRSEVRRALAECLARTNYAALLVYKGRHVDRTALKEWQRRRILSVNVFPDYSPIAYGQALAEALGEYSLVISTKVWHPAAWQPVFGYENECIFIPQGYDPLLHHVEDGWRTEGSDFDVVLVATHRPEYERLLAEAARVHGFAKKSVAVFGNGWERCRERLPCGWVFPGAVSGRAYIAAARSGRCCLAPVTRDVFLRGRKYPGDEDTTRTYELPAMGIAMVHRRTAYVESLLEDGSDAILFDNGEEMAEGALRLLADADLRRNLRRNGYRTIVPRHSMDARARDVSSAIARRVEESN